MTNQSNVYDFDATRPKRKTPQVKAKLKAFGEDWRLIRPNQMIAGALIDHDGEINVGYVNDYMVRHIHPDDREKFKAAAIADENLDLEQLMELMDMMTKAVYDEVPSKPS